MSEIKSVSVSELSGWQKDTYVIVDMRDELAYSYGHIPEAVNIAVASPEDAQIPEKYRAKRLVIYCQKGILSENVVAFLDGKGFDAYQLTGGYLAWLMENTDADNASCEEKTYLEIEQDLRKRKNEPPQNWWFIFIMAKKE